MSASSMALAHASNDSGVHDAGFAINKTGRQSRCNGSKSELQREIPRHDVSRDAEGLAEGVIQPSTGDWNRASLDLVGQAGKVFQRPSTVANFRQRFTEGFAVVGGFDDGQFLGFRIGRRRHFIENSPALSGVHGLPVCCIESLSRRSDAAVNITNGRFWDGRHDLTRCRVQDLAGFVVFR